MAKKSSKKKTSKKKATKKKVAKKVSKKTKEKASVKTKPGQPTKFNETARIVALNLYKKGAIDKEVAETLGVSARTIDNWKKDHPKFFQSIKEAKACPDDQIETRLFDQANGFEFVQNEVVETTRNKKKVTVKRKTTKDMPPEFQAIVFWLTNRRPEKWQRSQTLRHSGVEDLANGLNKARKRLQSTLLGDREVPEGGGDA